MRIGIEDMSLVLANLFVCVRAQITKLKEVKTQSTRDDRVRMIEELL
jgi:hypothetical protein